MISFLTTFDYILIKQVSLSILQSKYLPLSTVCGLMCHFDADSELFLFVVLNANSHEAVVHKEIPATPLSSTHFGISFISAVIQQIYSE